MSNSVIMRRLKSLEQRRQEAATRKTRYQTHLAERAERLGVSVELLAAIDKPVAHGSIALPLAAHYGRDEAFERRRGTFYAHMAMVFGSAGWRLSFYDHEMQIAAGQGYGERDRVIQPLDRDSAVNLNTAAAPLEWLVAKGKLETDQDEPGHGMVRFAAALRFRDEMDGAQVAALKGQAFDGASGGGAGGRPVSDYKLDCMATISAIREGMHPGLYRLLVWVVIDDVWAWEKARPGKYHRMLKRALAKARTEKGRDKITRMISKQATKEQNFVIEKLHKAIDMAAVTMGYVTAEDFRRRWLRRPKPASVQKAA